MQDAVDAQIHEARAGMEKAIAHLETELSKIRAGKASPGMLEGVFVDYYGANTPLNQVSSISTPDAKTLMIQPWEKNMLEPIERAIQEANLGIHPQNDGSVIRLNIPPLTEERRKELVKKIKEVAEEAKVSIRNARRDANEEIRSLVKEGLAEDEAKEAETRVQQETDKYVALVDKLVGGKEKQIMTV